jgi:hypothetical protein
LTRSRQTADWGSRAGLAKIVPSSVAVGSGTGSASALGTVTFTGASSIALNTVFSSTYQNYKVIINITTTAADADLILRFRSGVTDNADNNSQWAYWLRNTSGSNLSFDGVNANYIFLGSMETYTNTSLTNIAFDVYNPFRTTETGGNVQISTVNTSGAVTMGTGGFIKGGSTSWDGFVFGSSNSTNITGTISVYGYTN